MTVEQLPEEVKKIFVFFCKAKLSSELTLKLAYYLSHTKSCSMWEATEVLKVNRRKLYDEGITKNHPLFISEVRSKAGFGKGGTERRIILRPELQGLVPLIKYVAEDPSMLLPGECQRLREMASQGGREGPETEAKRAEQLETTMNILVKAHGTDKYPTFLESRAKIVGMTEDELDKKVVERKKALTEKAAPPRREGAP